MLDHGSVWSEYEKIFEWKFSLEYHKLYYSTEEAILINANEIYRGRLHKVNIKHGGSVTLTWRRHEQHKKS